MSVHGHTPRRILSLTKATAASLEESLQEALAGEYGEERAKELDGCFFEKFTTLNKAVEKNRSHIEAEMKKIHENHFEEIHAQMRELSKDQQEALYSEVLYTIIHQLGSEATKRSSLNPEELFAYVKRALRISQEQHTRLCAKTKERKAPTCILKVKIHEARGLQAKDANGLSDPYCMIGLLHCDDLVEEDKKGHRHRKKSKTLKDYSMDIQTCLTSVQRKTLDPKWSEAFTLTVHDANREIFHLDIWDWDDSSSILDEDNKISSIKGFAGMGRFLKKVVQSGMKSDNAHDYLGSIEIPVQNVPSKGLDGWFDLQGRSSHSNVSGQCHLQLKLSAPKRGSVIIPKYVSMHFKTPADVHAALLEQFVHNHFEDTKGSVNPNILWNGQLSPTADWILHQHAIQNEMMDLQKAVIHWRVYSQYHQVHQLEYDFLQSLLQLVKSLWPTITLSDKETQLLLQSLQSFLNFTRDLIKMHRDVFPGSQLLQIDRLKKVLECLKTIFEFEVFKATQKRPLLSFVEDALKVGILYVRCYLSSKMLSRWVFSKSYFLSSGLPESSNQINICFLTFSLSKLGTMEWFNKHQTCAHPHKMKEKDLLKSMVELADIAVLDINKGRKNYQNVFEIVGCDYFEVVYRQLEAMLSCEVQEAMMRVNFRIKDEQELIGKTLFKLYLTLKDVVGYQNELKASGGDCGAFALTNFYEWFSPAVTGWFNIARDKAKHRIVKAVELDQIVRIDSYVNHSTSAVDATGCLNQFCQFWQQLQWPDTAANYIFVTQITEDVCASAAFYTEILHQKLVKKGFSEDARQFYVTDQTCVTLNNMQYVEIWLKELPKRLDWDQVTSSMIEAHGQQTGRHAQQTLNTRLTFARDEIDKMIEKFVIQIARRMSVDVKKLLKSVAWSRETLDMDTAITPLLEYLDNNLITLHNNLIAPVFRRILSQIWVVVLENFLHLLKSQIAKPRKFYQRLEEAMKILEEFFYADGAGVSLEKIKTPLKQKVQGLMTLYTSSSEYVIERFFEEKVKDQMSTRDTSLGTLTFKVFYSCLSSTLRVEVLSASGLKALDKNGFSDPFVTAELLPKHYFPDVPPLTTQVIKKTLNPVFNENFEFLDFHSMCKRPGSCILFTVMDYDVLFGNDVAGHVLFPLSDLAGLDKDIPDNNLAHILPIIHLQPSGKHFKVLESRDDKFSRDFVRDLKQRHGKASAGHEKAMLAERKQSKVNENQLRGS